MDKSAITFTCGREWWLERVTIKGRERYPKLIRVGEFGKERVYLPRRTCRDKTSAPQSFLCSECGWFDTDFDDFPLNYNYCPHCGARVVSSDDR